MDRRLRISVAAFALSGCGMGGAGGGVSFPLAPSFMPDPQTATGGAGGLTDASTLTGDCRGYIAARPNHILTATAAFSNLRIAVHCGGADLTPVAQRPDGTPCNDDAEGLSPMVEDPFAQGEHRIVGLDPLPGVEDNERITVEDANCARAVIDGRLALDV